jgi:putative ABC transport system permease protein
MNMKWLRFWQRQRRDAELAYELEAHIERETADRIAAGKRPDEARFEAMRKLGNITRIREDVYEHNSILAFETVWQDVSYAWRMIRKQPGFAAAAVLVLALGIGATTAIFSVVNSVMINPLPFPESDALVSIVHTVDGRDEACFGDAIYTLYTEQNRAFDAFGVWTPYAGAATVTGQGDPEEVRVLAVSQGLLTALGVRPEIGRPFSVVDDTPGAPDTVILTNGYWQRTFGGDPDVVKRVLTINSRPHQIIGVMPAEFQFGGAVVNTTLRVSSSDIILPLRIDRAAPVPVWRHLGVARLKPGVTLAQANADVGRMVAIWSAPSERTNWPSAFRNTRYGASLRLLKQDVVGNVGRMLWVLMGTIGIVLLMACANVATLLLVRADARRQEFAIRAALGARWTRVARALLVESLTLALLGGALGVALAYGGLRVLVAIGPSDLPRLSEISIDTVVLGFAVLVSLLSGLLFGLIPILRYAKPQLATALGGGRGASLTRGRQRSQHALVAVQIALALVLLVSSGLMIRSFQELRRIDPGFTNPESVQTFSVSIPPREVAEPEGVTRRQHEILERIAAIPGVASAAFTSRLPMDTSGRTGSPLFAEGKADDGRSLPSRQIRFISPGMFRTLGTPLIVGGDFTWIDIHDKREVAILSENLAREMWGSPTAALGKRIREENGVWRDVVGVTGDIYDEGVSQRPTPTLFLPARLHARTLGLSSVLSRRVTFVIRSERTGTETLLNQVREAVGSVNADLPLAQVRTLGEVYDQSIARTSFTLVMLAIAGAIALLLGVSGLSGVISYAVSQRRREIGMRLALGAQPRQIRGLFVRRGLVVVGLGVAIGLGAAAGFTRLMQSLLFGISPLDPITFTAMPVVLVGTAVLASYLSTRRALAVDPVETLRAE